VAGDPTGIRRLIQAGAGEILRRREESVRAERAAPAGGKAPAPLLADFDEELKRAQRYGAPLSVVLSTSTISRRSTTRAGINSEICR
jgi:hypothetical protein